MSEARAVSREAVALVAGAGPVPTRKAVIAALAEERVNGRVLTAGQADRLTLAAGLSVGSLEDRRKAARLVRAVEAELREASEAAAVHAGVSDTLQRMAERGEAFEESEAEEGDFIRDRHGAAMRHQGELMFKSRRARRISRADGLRSLHRSGALSDGEVAVAERIRTLAERARPPISSGQIDPVRVDGGLAATSDQLVAAAITRGDAAMRWTLIREAVSPWDDLLSAVVVRGETVRSCGSGGNVKAANVSRLKWALGVADDLQMTRGDQQMAVLP